MNLRHTFSRRLNIRVLLALCAIIIVLPLAGLAVVRAQFGECNINLSAIMGGLTEAQAAASSGDTDIALDVIRAAAEALTRIADACEQQLALNTPEATAETTPSVEVTETVSADSGTPEPRTMQSLSVPGNFYAPNGVFAFDYPPEWTISDFISISSDSGAISVGSTTEAITALNAQSPVLSSGQQAVLILGGSVELITSGELNAGGIEAILSYYQGIGERTYSETSTPETFDLNGRAAGRLTFGGEGFDAYMIAIEIETDVRYAVIVGTSAKGERDAIATIVDSIALTIR